MSWIRRDRVARCCCGWSASRPPAGIARRVRGERQRPGPARRMIADEVVQAVVAMATANPWYGYKRIAMRLGPPPQSYANWTLRLLARKVAALEIAESVSYETVRRTLKKRDDQSQDQYWVIPPDADAEFVAAMEAVLDTDEKPYDPACPVHCMDQQPVQLVQETRQPLPATKRHAKRIDYEYERVGTATIAAWSNDVNNTQRGVDWQMKVKDARGKLKSLYPKIRP